jgi:integrative and conjugative element protein (TIGR02256 family)
MADRERFSSAYASVPRLSLPHAVQFALDEVTRALGGRQVDAVRWNDNSVAVPFDVAVDLPSRGPVGGIDIRSVEPVLLRFDLANYPVVAPSAYSDRKDFPASQLPHLNPVRSGQPFSLCLHRGSMDDWFAEHTIADFLERVRSWLRDAAADRLMREGDYFEPTRFSSSFGIMVFDPRTLAFKVSELRGESEYAAGRVYFHARVSRGDGEGWDNQLACSLEFTLDGRPSDEDVERVSGWNAFPAELRHYELWTVGILLWPRRAACWTYFGLLPSTYGELVEFASQLGISLPETMAEYHGSNAKQCAFIPVTICVPRPRPLLGTSSQLEWLSFVIVVDDGDWQEQGHPKVDALVLPVGHRRPLTPTLAEDLSGRGKNPTLLTRPLIVGAGALGSRLSLHLAKGGAVNQDIVDHGTLTPHHMVRHGLLARHLGKNKAEALRAELADMYRKAPNVEPKAHAGSAFDVLRDTKMLAETSLLIDASASSSVLNAIVQARLTVPICRVEIANAGRLGMLSVEGANRNPRLDDLQAHLWQLGVTTESVANWLGRHREEIEGARGPALEEIGIGIGCSSVTMRLADDVVAYHASQFAMAIRLLLPKLGGAGLIRLCQTTEDRALETVDVIVPPIREFHPKNGRGWTIRMSLFVDRVIQEELRLSGRSETGGLLLGYMHKKRRVVYVTGVLRASPDSVGTPSGFVRGVDGYREQLEVIKTSTGGLIGYVGEWHTHPRGKPEPSRRDRDTAGALKAVLAFAEMPVVMVIAAERGTKAYLYD